MSVAAQYARTGVLRDHECADFRTAAEPHAAHIADAACHVNLPRSPGLQAGDVSLVGDRSITRSVVRHNHLTSMGVAGEHQVPPDRAQLPLTVGVMAENHAGPLPPQA